MKVKANQLYDFVRKTSFNGAIPGSVYKMTELGLENFNKTPDTMGIAHGILCKSNIKDAAAGFSFGIGSNDKLMKCLKEFGEEEIDIIVNETVGRMHLVGKGLQVECVMTSPAMIDSTLEQVPESLHWDFEPFVINSDTFKKAVNYARILENNTLKLKAENGELMVVNGETNFDQFTQKFKVAAPDFEAEYGEALQSVVGVLEGPLRCWAQSNYPLKFEEESTAYKFMAIVAPIVAKE